jgi:hypothetical protein
MKVYLPVVILRASMVHTWVGLFAILCKRVPKCDFKISHNWSGFPSDFHSLQDAVVKASDGNTICYRQSQSPYADCPRNGTRIIDKSVKVTVETGNRGDAIIDCEYQGRYIWANANDGNKNMVLSIEHLVITSGFAAAGGLVLAQVRSGTLLLMHIYLASSCLPFWILTSVWLFFKSSFVYFEETKRQNTFVNGMSLSMTGHSLEDHRMRPLLFFKYL